MEWSKSTYHYLQVPYTEKDEAKALGARWDSNKKQWYYTGKVDNRFNKWTPTHCMELSDLSNEQQTMIKLAKQGKNVLVDACIGSGKTTTTTLIRVEKNVSEDIDLSYALVNGEEFHLDGETSVADYVKLAKMKLALGGSYHDSEILQFRGYMYESVEDIENDKKTKVSLEVINKDGEIIVSDDELRNTPEELFIKGISTSTFFTGEDFTVEFANGLKVGLTQNEIIDKFGEGKVIDDVLLGRISIYNNGTNSIFIMYEKKNNEYVADDIYMFIN